MSKFIAAILIIVGIAVPAFAQRCYYILGDVNASGSFTGMDVAYSVAFFKGGPPPHYSCYCNYPNLWYVSGDVNGSCSFNGLDVTYMVAYLKGFQPRLLYCNTCPPM